MGDTLTQVGIGGVLVLLILDRVFAFLKNKSSGDTSPPKPDSNLAGNQSNEYWQKTTKSITAETIEAMVLPIQRAQTEILARLEVKSGQVYEMGLKQSYVLDDVNKSIEKLRVGQHAIGNSVQNLMAQFGHSGRRATDQLPD